ncbi:MAG: hypothetical protein RJQ00_08110 [Vicingaceae bacterium]
MNFFEVKVLIETKNTVYRDLLLSSENNLEELFKAIIDAFGFEGKQMASFIIEGDGWQAAAEYPLEALGENDSKLMSDIKLSEVFKNIGDHLTLIYDYMNEWKFQIEVIGLNEQHSIKETPALLKSVGKAPNENERELSGNDAESILMNAILGDEFAEDENDDDLFDSDDFDSLDDYEEYQ